MTWPFGAATRGVSCAGDDVGVRRDEAAARSTQPEPWTPDSAGDALDLDDARGRRASSPGVRATLRSGAGSPRSGGAAIERQRVEAGERLSTVAAGRRRRGPRGSPSPARALARRLPRPEARRRRPARRRRGRRRCRSRRRRRSPRARSGLRETPHRRRLPDRLAADLQQDGADHGSDRLASGTHGELFRRPEGRAAPTREPTSAADRQAGEREAPGATRPRRSRRPRRAPPRAGQADRPSSPRHRPRSGSADAASSRALRAHLRLVAGRVRPSTSNQPSGRYAGHLLRGRAADRRHDASSSRCSGRGCRRARAESPRRSGSGSRRAAPWPRSACRACRSRTGRRLRRGRPAGAARSSSPSARPSTVVISRPSACRAR